MQTVDRTGHQHREDLSLSVGEDRGLGPYVSEQVEEVASPGFTSAKLDPRLPVRGRGDGDDSGPW